MLTVSHLAKSFGQQPVLHDVSLTVGKGQVISILGPSGSGKSTLLRCLNHLEKPTAGEMIFDGQTINLAHMSTEQIQTVRRNMGMVFQHYNLFSHKSALANIMEGLLTVKKQPYHDAETLARHYLALVGLSDRADYYPASLSGGQQQRIAIARALAMSPKLILLDEPTSSLDPELVSEVLAVIKKIANEGVTMIIVTHEMKFAYDISDRIIFMDGGYVVEEGPPAEVFINPQSERARKFFSQTAAAVNYCI